MLYFLAILAHVEVYFWKFWSSEGQAFANFVQKVPSFSVFNQEICLANDIIFTKISLANSTFFQMLKAHHSHTLPKFSREPPPHGIF